VTGFAATSDGIRIAFERFGAGAPVVLVHGFGSSAAQNWKSTGWYGSLAEAGYEVIAIDCRGHGHSDKPHDEALYGHDRMAADVVAVLDLLAIAAAPYVGYSMGGFIGLRLLQAHPARITRLALGGVGAHYLTGPRVSDPQTRIRIAEALLADDKSAITDPRGRLFRDFADQPGKDRSALAACMRAMSPPLAPDALRLLPGPILTVCGERDDISGPAAPLAAAFAQGAAVAIPGRDHMSAVGDIRTRRAVLDFLQL
jgi:pimeloyl-ACP methyl ester carboxylesterase